MFLHIWTAILVYYMYGNKIIVIVNYFYCTHALLESLRAVDIYELLDDNPYSNPNLNYNKLHSCIISWAQPPILAIAHIAKFGDQM